MGLAKEIARRKIYLDRARSYMNYVQLILLLKLVLSDAGIDELWMIVVGVVGLLVVIMIVGYLDTKLGIRKRELENNFETNPMSVELLKRVKIIEDAVLRSSVRRDDV